MRDLAADLTVETVLGPTAPGQLGRTQMHEHLLLDIYPSRWSFEHILDDIDVAVEELERFRGAGGGGIVEVTPRGAGRDPRGLREISQRSDVHIVMGTSFLWGSPVVDDLLTTRGPDDLAELMVRDLTEGVDDTGIRAGVIGEVGCGSTRSSGGKTRINPAEERLLRAASRAQLQTGALIYTDTFHGELALDQLAILSEEGVDLGRVVIGHLGDRRQTPYYQRIAEAGANLGFDHAGMTNCAPDNWRVDTLRQLIDSGWEQRIVLSMDVHRRSYWHCMGGAGYDYLLNQFVPMLREGGISDNAIDTMLVDNPARLLPFQRC
ncbi:MAG: hypothetical protein VX733_15195 [Candidatus Latescibacterota bacterium]|nr:hypothetical protein [Candidatus Latescibacterota bacterium]